MTRDSLRTYVPFRSDWRMRIEHPYSLWVQDGQVGWSCGQCPLDSNGQVIAPGDLVAQTRYVASLIEQTLRSGQLGSVHVAKLVAYYVPDATSGPALEELAERLGVGLIVPVAVRHFYYDGMLIEIDVFCSRSPPAEKVPGSAALGPHLTLIDAVELFYAAVSWSHPQLKQPDSWGAALALLEQVMAVHNLCSDQLISDRWFVIGLEATQLLKAAYRDGYCRDPGCAAACKWDNGTGAIAELTFVANSEASPSAELTDESVSLRRRGRFVSITARETTGGTTLSIQTNRSMQAVGQMLERIGSNFADISKATTLYVGGNSAAELHENMSIRNSFYERPGPASTGVPVGGFPFSESLVSIDLLGTLSRSWPGSNLR